MAQHTKKRLVAGLLFISCVIAAWLLFITPANDSKNLRHFSQADSLLKVALSDFNLGGRRVSTYKTHVDSNFSRLTYTIDVPPNFSKTQFHSVLKNRLAPYHISVPARVIFPEKNMHIYFDYNETIIRTLQLVTNKDLHIQRSYASVIVAFEERPPAEMLEQVKSLGEPIPVATIFHPPFSEPDWWDEVKEKYGRLYFWLKSEDNENLLSGVKKTSPSSFRRMNDEFSAGTLLSFYSEQNRLPQQYNSFSFVDVHSAQIFNAQMDESTFRQTFRQWVEQARKGKRPIAIIMGNEKTIHWMQDELNTFRKGGLSIITPPKVTF